MQVDEEAAQPLPGRLVVLIHQPSRGGTTRQVDELYLWLLGWPEKIEPLYARLRDSGNAVAAFFDALAEWVTGPGRGGCLIVNLMAEDGGANEEIAARTEAFRGRLRAALRSGLVRAAALGEIDEGTVEWRAQLLVVAVMGLDVLARGCSARSDVAGQVAALRQLIDSWRTT